MTRIIAGSAKGRTLKVPSKGTRPTSDRMREALFSRLDHWGVIDGAYVVDLYAGSGALGLEAASRGAKKVYLVDSSREAAQTMRDNVRATKFSHLAHVYHNDARKFLLRDLPQTLHDSIDLVFIDPPYDSGENEVEAVLVALLPFLHTDSLIIVERSRRSVEPQWPSSLVLEEQRSYGDTTLWFVGVRRQGGSVHAAEQDVDRHEEQRGEEE